MTEARINLNAIQRHDNCATDLIDTSPHVAVYEHVNGGWTKTGVEGALHIYRRSQEPQFCMCIINRNSMENMLVPITSDFEVKSDDTYLFFRTADDPSRVKSLWFHRSDDRGRIESLVEKLSSGEYLKTKMRTPQPPAVAKPMATKPVPATPSASLTLMELFEPSNKQSVTRTAQVPPVQSQQSPRTLTAEELEKKLLMQNTIKFNANPPQASVNAEPVAPATSNGHAFHQVQPRSMSTTTGANANASTTYHSTNVPPPPILTTTSFDEFKNLSEQEQKAFFMSMQQGRQQQAPVVKPMAVVAPPQQSYVASGYDRTPTMDDSKLMYPTSMPSALLQPTASSLRRQAASFSSQQGGMSRNYSMIPNVGSPTHTLSELNSIGNGGDSPPLSVRAQPAAISESVAPLTREQIAQALTYLLKHDAGFTTQLHEAYVKSLNESIRRNQRQRDD